MQQRRRCRLALAALPVVLFAQCAPQCAPAPAGTTPTIPPPPTLSPSSTTQPPAPWSSSRRDITPSVSGQYSFRVDGMSRDGARIEVDFIEGTGRIDVASGHLDVSSLRGELTEDGTAIIGLTPDPIPQLRRHVMGDADGTGDVAYPPLPAGWQISRERFGVTIDDLGRHIAVVGVNPTLGRVGLFNLDAATGSWSQPVGSLAMASLGTGRWGQLFSADGSTIAVAYSNDQSDGSGHDELWHIGPHGVAQLINEGTGGGPAPTGHSWLLDMTPDGRHVLFGSTSELPSVGGWSYGAVFVRDTVTGSTSMVRRDANPEVGSISDDGRVVAFAGISDGPFPTLAIRTGDVWSTRRPALSDPQADAVGGDLVVDRTGTRIAYSTLYGRVVVIDVVGIER